MEAARREAQAIIDEARTAANLASEELKALRRQLQDSADTTGINQRQAELRRSLNEAEDRLRVNAPQKQRPAASRGILVGDTVELLKLGTKASVLAINKDGSYQLQAGIMKLTARPDEVYLLEHENPYQAKGGRPAHSGREMKMQAMPTEVDLRGMDSVEAICVLDRYLDEAMRAKLDGATVKVLANVGEEGQLFGSVTSSIVADAIKENFGVEVDRRRVELGNPIKVAGEHAVAISIYRDIKATVTVSVVSDKAVEAPEEEEAVEASAEEAAAPAEETEAAAE